MTRRNKQTQVPREFNYIYSKLVQEPNDIVGLLAYSIYKEHKIAYITDFTSKNGRAPSDTELMRFHDSSSTEACIATYKENAAQKMRDVLDQLMQDNIEAFRKASKEAEQEAHKSLEPTIKTHAYSGIIGNFSFILCSVVILILARFIKSDAPSAITAWLKGLVGL